MQLYTAWAKSVGHRLGPKYILYAYMDFLVVDFIVVIVARHRAPPFVPMQSEKIQVPT